MVTDVLMSLSAAVLDSRSKKAGEEGAFREELMGLCGMWTWKLWNAELLPAGGGLGAICTPVRPPASSNHIISGSTCLKLVSTVRYLTSRVG